MFSWCLMDLPVENFFKTFFILICISLSILTFRKNCKPNKPTNLQSYKCKKLFMAPEIIIFIAYVSISYYHRNLNGVNDVIYRDTTLFMIIYFTNSVTVCLTYINFSRWMFFLYFYAWFQISSPYHYSCNIHAYTFFSGQMS